MRLSRVLVGSLLVVSCPVVAPNAVAGAAAAPGTQLWMHSLYTPQHGWAIPRSVTVSADGRRAFVEGIGGVGEYRGYAVAAYDVATGTRQWVRRTALWRNLAEFGSSLAASRDGTRVFVSQATPHSATSWSDADYVTTAYAAATGTPLWAARYVGTGNANDVPRTVAVSPNGAVVFVTGKSHGAGTNMDWATVAYNAQTGRRLWVQRYNGPGSTAAKAYDEPLAMTVGPGGGRVYVTGRSWGNASRDDVLTIAYAASTGRRLWVKRYNGPANGDDVANAIVAGPGGGRVFVTGQSPGIGSKRDYVTLAYNAVTGARLWTARYNGPGNGNDYARAIVTSSGGGKVFVTGQAFLATASGVAMYDDATVAYNGANGARVWVSRIAGDWEVRPAIAVGPTGAVYATGGGLDYTTVAYSPSGGTQLWSSRFSTAYRDAPAAIAVSAGTGTVIVTGRTGDDEMTNWATIAYVG